MSYFSCFTQTQKGCSDRCRMLEGTKGLAGRIAGFQLLPSQPDISACYRSDRSLRVVNLLASPELVGSGSSLQRAS